MEKALVYVPGGKAPYPSSLVMGAVPARIAGVKEIYATTPARDGASTPILPPPPCSSISRVSTG